jgi:hypothetical protein
VGIFDGLKKVFGISADRPRELTVATPAAVFLCAKKHGFAQRSLAEAPNQCIGQQWRGLIAIKIVAF